MKKIRTYIYKRKYRSEKTVWMVRWWDNAAYKWRAMVGGKNKDEAIISEAKIRDDLLHGVNPAAWLAESPCETVSELIEAFYQTAHYQTCGESWRKIMRYHLDGHIKETLGHFRFSELTREILYSFYLDLKNKHGLCNSSILKYHLKICYLGDLYIERHSDKTNIARQLRDFRKRFPREAPVRVINFLTPDEISKIMQELEKTTSDLAFPFTKLLVHTGMRRNEARNLKWTDIDFAGGFIDIRTSKNGKSRRVPLEREAREAIESMPRRSEYIFVHEDGSRPDPHSLRRPFQRAAKRAGIQKRVDLHTLRHSFGSNRIRSGELGMPQVSRILGHSDINVTDKIYSHFLDGDHKLRREFAFDNHGQKSNSNKNGVSATITNNDVAELAKRMDATQVMVLIQMLQKQIEGLMDSKPAVLSAPSQNKSEELRKTPSNTTIASKTAPVSNAYATWTQKKPQQSTVDLSHKNKKALHLQGFEFGRGGGIRTHDPLHPMQVR